MRILERRASLLLDRMPDVDGRGDTDADEVEENTDNDDDDDDDEADGVDEGADDESISAPLALRESCRSAALTSSRPPTDWLSGPTNASADP